ncbi:hypothetical protein [Endozoicomonas numazuensis]|uniref:hypothetical protein n=1 Tax=Endozoicomonas numazuensis TaxID=1137799 RepID=UPI001F26035D|nr:hypothetical protein [Endozoicomonas numazuensis]
MRFILWNYCIDGWKSLVCKVNTGKTRLLEFGRFAAGNRKQKNRPEPETFDFLGFTHIC